MFARIRHLISQFFHRTSTINNEPLNKVSLIVIILVDIFILSNVFWGLGDISQWHLNPAQAYPCYAGWQAYQKETSPAQTRDFNLIRTPLSDTTTYSPTTPKPPWHLRKAYENAAIGHLGQVSPVCLQFADHIEGLKNAPNQQTVKQIDQLETQISNLEQKNRQIRAEYDSTLLERITGQPREQSINAVAAEKAKQQLEQNKQQISKLKQDISKLKTTLLAKPEVKRLMAFLQDNAQFSVVETGYNQASFWYPTIQLAFQALFLLPLIAIALAIHRFAQRKGYGLMALISWHLLVIFLIPLVIKVFEFLQIGVIFNFIAEIIQKLLGGLLFLVSYVYILLIPLIGFGIIKFFQAVVFNPKVQAVNRAQKSRCLKCAKKIRQQDVHCPYCGFYQYLECPNCHTLTYKHLPYCKECGHAQAPNH